jgi:hypothetical protein
MTTLDKRLAEITSRAERLYAENRALGRGLASRDKDIDKLNRLILRITEAKKEIHGTPKWTVKSPKTGARHGTICLMLSDLHLDEVVRSENVGGLNVYNRRIAEDRLQHTFEQAASLPVSYAGGISFDGIVCFLGGDILTGDIHDELKETNESTPMESVVHWVPRLAAGITLLADTYGRVHVPCVDGNHDRNGKDYRYKRRPQSAVSWVLYHWLADQLSSDRRITFEVSASTECRVPVYGTSFLLRHGDGWTGGSGNVGPVGPVRSANLRLMRREMASGSTHDWLVVGHWHTYMQGLGLIMNGSLKGYDEYAFDKLFDYEPPQQALWVVTPEHGVTLSMPIFCSPKEEAHG